MAHYLRALGIAEIIDAAIPRRGKALASHGEIACVLAARRLCSPAPLYDIAGWASSAAVTELLGTPAALLNDDRLGPPWKPWPRSPMTSAASCCSPPPGGSRSRTPPGCTWT